MFTEQDTVITLLGKVVAEPDYEFIFLGESGECRKCKLRNTCLNLSEGSRYKVVRLRPSAPVHQCPLHEGGVLAVEVIEVPYTLAIESRKAFEGSKIVYTSVGCDNRECEMYDLCNPPGIEEGEKGTIVNVLGPLPKECPNGYSLKLVEFQRA
ncbi:MAG: UPF0179 family protein [Methermicoccaceae archaeon]